MQEQHPHAIRRFRDGEQIPEGYVELTEEQFRLLDPMSPDERGAWLEANGTRTPVDARLAKLGLVEELDAPEAAARHEREQFLRTKGRRQNPSDQTDAPRDAQRRHRRQNR